MAYTYLLHSSTTDATKANDNFSHVASGDRLPMGGSALAATTGVYNLGESTATWNNTYCQTLQVSGSVTTDQLWTPMINTVLEGTGSSIIINYSGDDKTEWKLIFAVRATVDVTFASYYLSLGFGSALTGAAGSLSEEIIAASSTVTASQTSPAWFTAKTTASIGSMVYFYGEVDFFVKTGHPRTGIMKSCAMATTTTITEYKIQAMSHGDITNTLTYFSIGYGPGYMVTDSTFQLWGRG